MRGVGRGPVEKAATQAWGTSGVQTQLVYLRLYPKGGYNVEEVGHWPAGQESDGNLGQLTTARENRR